MKTVDLLKHESGFVFSELLTTLDGLTEGQAWAVLPQGGSDYLHSDGSIHGIALHIASCKRMYGSVGFRNTEVRWRDCANEIEKFEPSWPAALEYLHESQRYWLGTWATLGDDDLDAERPHFRGRNWPAWKIIATMIHHDSYHAGQIAVLRYAIGESEVPPPSVAADIRQCCAELPSW
ncbi:MAG: DinB family protein [Fimbriimonadales bacterium]